MKVSEVFYSLQGEGGRAGEASVFIRLSGCSAKHACATSGVVCDTEFESGVEMNLDELCSAVLVAMSRAAPQVGTNHAELLPWIVWTGGEPLDQLTPEIISKMNERGWKRHALETSGVVPMSSQMAGSINWITVSPKVAEHILLRHFPWTEHRPLDELRYVRHAGQPGVPMPVVKARNYYLSPHSDGFTINKENVDHCVKLCLANPRWKMSVQQHKVWSVL